MIIKFNENNNNIASRLKRYKRVQMLFLAHGDAHLRSVYYAQTLSGLGAQFGRRFEVYNILLCTTTQWYNMLYYACLSRQSETQCTNVDPAAIMWLEIVRNGFGPFNARRVGTTTSGASL